MVQVWIINRLWKCHVPNAVHVTTTARGSRTTSVGSALVVIVVVVALHHHHCLPRAFANIWPITRMSADESFRLSSQDVTQLVTWRNPMSHI